VATFKVTEIRVTAGKDVILIEPKSLTWVIEGKNGHHPDPKLIAKVFKSIAGNVESYFDLLRNAKASDFRS